LGGVIGVVIEKEFLEARESSAGHVAIEIQLEGTLERATGSVERAVALEAHPDVGKYDPAHRHLAENPRELEPSRRRHASGSLLERARTTLRRRALAIGTWEVRPVGSGTWIFRPRASRIPAGSEAFRVHRSRAGFHGLPGLGCQIQFQIPNPVDAQKLVTRRGEIAASAGHRQHPHEEDPNTATVEEGFHRSSTAESLAVWQVQRCPERTEGL
jgi:hypothetical protein